MLTATIQIKYHFDTAPIVAAMRAKKITNRQLGIMAEISEVHICRILKGTYASEKAVRNICTLLGVPFDEVIRPRAHT